MTTTTRNDEPGAEQDAIEMLMADHKKVKKLFGNFATHKDDGDDEDKSAIVKMICNELKVHTVAVIDDRTAYGQGVANEFKTRAEEIGLRFAGHHAGHPRHMGGHPASRPPFS